MAKMERKGLRVEMRPGEVREEEVDSTYVLYNTYVWEKRTASLSNIRSLGENTYHLAEVP